MALLGTARALDDQNFVWRVGGACMVSASARAVSGQASNERNYARAVLLNPQQVDKSMLAFVALDSAVAEAITVNVNDATVDTRTVTDTQIQTAVDAAWSKVAVKYPNDPFSTSPRTVP